MQLSMDLPVAFPKEAYEYGRRSSGETHGGGVDQTPCRRADPWRLVKAAKAARVRPGQPAISTVILLNKPPTAFSRSLARRWLVRIDFDANGVAECLGRGQQGRSHASKWIEDGVFDERKHAYQPVGEFQGKRSRMLLGRGSRKLPELLEPNVKVLLVN